MSESITSFDVFESFFDFIKDPDTTLEMAIAEYGGGNLYIPSYKSTMRNEKIREEYSKRVGEPNLIRNLCKEFDLTTSGIYAITKDLREPSLL